MGHIPQPPNNMLSAQHMNGEAACENLRQVCTQMRQRAGVRWSEDTNSAAALLQLGVFRVFLVPTQYVWVTGTQRNPGSVG
jgi:hypothetical protein